jgi:hypothetical protein
MKVRAAVSFPTSVVHPARVPTRDSRAGIGFRLRVPHESWIGLRVTRAFGRFGRVDSRVPPESLREGAAGNPHKRDGFRRLNSGAIGSHQYCPSPESAWWHRSDFVDVRFRRTQSAGISRPGNRPNRKFPFGTCEIRSDCNRSKFRIWTQDSSESELLTLLGGVPIPLTGLLILSSSYYICCL